MFVNGATSMEKCDAACKTVKNAVPVLADLTKTEDIAALGRKTGGVDILVLNASVQYKRAWDEFSEEEFDKQFNLNVKSSYLLMLKYEPFMKGKGLG